jgi:hypothetical protein
MPLFMGVRGYAWVLMGIIIHEVLGNLAGLGRCWLTDGAGGVHQDLVVWGIFLGEGIFSGLGGILRGNVFLA